jgi:DNA-directed RNA polymerase specialized sigma24 family protein
LLRALTKLAGLRDDVAFRAWLHQIVITVHRNRCRRAFWRRLIPLADRDAPGDDGGVAGAHDYRTTEWSPEAAGGNVRGRAWRAW